MRKDVSASLTPLSPWAEQKYKSFFLSNKQNNLWSDATFQASRLLPMGFRGEKGWRQTSSLLLPLFSSPVPLGKFFHVGEKGEEQRRFAFVSCSCFLEENFPESV